MTYTRRHDVRLERGADEMMNIVNVARNNIFDIRLQTTILFLCENPK